MNTSMAAADTFPPPTRPHRLARPRLGLPVLLVFLRRGTRHAATERGHNLVRPAPGDHRQPALADPAHSGAATGPPDRCRHRHHALVFSLFSLGYFAIYGQEFSQSVIFIMFESNPAEASEYFRQYFAWWMVPAC